MKKKLTRKKIKTYKKKAFNLIFFIPFIILFLAIGVILYFVNNGVINTKAKAVPDNNPAFIVDGHDAKRGAWPFMAILYFKARFQKDMLNVSTTPLYKHNLNDIKHCAGTLIGPRWVLTAGHCVYLHKKEVIGVAFGFYDLKDPLDTKTRFTRDVERIILHPDFQMLPSYHPINDLALLELTESVTNIPTVSLIDTNKIDGLNAAVIGWGEMEDANKTSILQEVTIPVIPNNVSNQSDWYNNQILDTMLTAGIEQGGKGVCWGDSGGPLLIWSNSRWKQAGIVSWNKKSPDLKCETPKKPGVYTRVSSFAPWIKSITGINTNSGTFTGLNSSISQPYPSKVL